MGILAVLVVQRYALREQLLLRKLASSDPAVCRDAARELAALGTSSALPAIVDAIGDERLSVEEGAEVLEHLCRADTTQLVDALASRSWPVHQAATMAVFLPGSWREIAANADHPGEALSVRLLEMLDTEEYEAYQVGQLRRLLAAVSSPADQGGGCWRPSPAALIDQLPLHPSRSELLRSVFEECLHSADSRTRASAVRALARWAGSGWETVAAHLKGKLDTCEVDVLSETGLFGSKAAGSVDALARLARSENLAVAKRAYVALAGIGPSAAPALEGLLLESRSQSLHSGPELVWLLAATGESGLQVCLEILRSPSSLLTDSALVAVSFLGAAAVDASPSLLELASSEHTAQYRRVLALRALASIGHRAEPIADRLLGHLTDDSPRWLRTRWTETLLRVLPVGDPRVERLAIELGPELWQDDGTQDSSAIHAHVPLLLKSRPTSKRLREMIWSGSRRDQERAHWFLIAKPDTEEAALTIEASAKLYERTHDAMLRSGALRVIASHLPLVEPPPGADFVERLLKGGMECAFGRQLFPIVLGLESTPAEKIALIDRLTESHDDKACIDQLADGETQVLLARHELGQFSRDELRARLQREHEECVSDDESAGRVWLDRQRYRALVSTARIEPRELSGWQTWIANDAHTSALLFAQWTHWAETGQGARHTLDSLVGLGIETPFFLKTHSMMQTPLNTTEQAELGRLAREQLGRLLGHIDSAAWRVRFGALSLAALAAGSEDSDRRLRRACVPRLKDAALLVRHRAADALRALGLDDRTREPLREMESDENPRVARLAGELLDEDGR